MVAEKDKPRILVADDDPILRRFLEVAIQQQGFLVRVCENGTQALEQAEAGSFSLLVIDYRLGTPNGFQVLQKLRKQGVTTPAILISSHFPDEVAVESGSLEAVSLLQKPFSLTALRTAIERSLIPNRK